MDQAWFEMRAIRRRPISGMVWIPLRSSKIVAEEGRYGFSGFSQEFFGLGSVALPLDQRAEGERLGWNDIGLIHQQRPYAFRGGYKPADIYQYHEEHDLGLELVLDQTFPGELITTWHLHQDIVMAFNLYREGDAWLCPDEAFLEVAKITRNGEGYPNSLEMRSDFLRDYLAARNMALRVTWYRQRMATVDDASFITWPALRLSEDSEGGRFEGRCWRACEGGEALGAGVAVFHTWRTDVDPEIDVPAFEPGNGENTDYEARSFTRKSERTVFMVEGEVWHSEWIEPASHSVRVRRDEVPPTAFFIVDAEGKRESRATLFNEDVGKYLWFRGGIISSILQYRGAKLNWFTADTGNIELVPGHRVHFGMNKLGLINVYAYDVAKLPDWQQQLWAGHNVGPEGGVSDELLASQMRARPADTHSPETLLALALDELNEAFLKRYGHSLIREHEAIPQILRSIYRFRATDRTGLLALAKDVARLTADSIDTNRLNAVIAPPKGEKWGSLKSLEKVLATLISEDTSHKLMSPLVGIYNLRLGDAHLPSEKIEEALELVGLDQSYSTVVQGAQLIMAAAWSIHSAAEALSGQLDSST